MCGQTYGGISKFMALLSLEDPQQPKLNIYYNGSGDGKRRVYEFNTPYWWFTNLK